MRVWKAAAELLAGRWQVPLAACALIAAAAAIYRISPAKPDVPFDALLADVLALVEAGNYYDAADAIGNLLALEPPLSTEQRGVLHETLAQTILLQEQSRGIPNLANAEKLLEHQNLASLNGRRQTTDALMRLGQAHEWLGHARDAVETYRSVLASDHTPEQRRIATQALVRLLEGRPDAAAERRGYIKLLLDEEGVSTAYQWWALRHALQERLEAGDLEQARELLLTHGELFGRSDLRGYFDYLWAWIHVREGNTDAAEPLIERVAAWVREHHYVDPDMDRAGFLPAMNFNLWGRLDLLEDRPQEAMSRFDDALSLQSHGDVLVEAVLGQSRALAVLGRHDTNRTLVRDALDRLAVDPTVLSLAIPRFRHETLDIARSLREAGNYADAIAYQRLVLEKAPPDEEDRLINLLENLAQDCDAAANATDDLARRWELYRAASEYYEQAADKAQPFGPRRAALVWAGAQAYDLAGDTANARRLLELFLQITAQDPRTPRAMLQIGQTYAADNMLPEAIAAYADLVDRFPRLEEASRAKLLTASALTSMGSGRYTEATEILYDLLEDEHITPEAQVFRDALFMLCDVLYEQGRYADAISRTEDFLIFYPDDPEQMRVMFRLADSYRRSALALRDDVDGGPAAARASVSHERLERAADLFSRFDVLATDRNSGDELDAQYARLALFYLGDCLMALNDPEHLRLALSTYRQAAARYQGEPAALNAQIQIANIYLRQGRRTEAARAVERARWLLRSIPDQAFESAADGMDRNDWELLVTTVVDSPMFQDVLADSRQP